MPARIHKTKKSRPHFVVFILLILSAVVLFLIFGKKITLDNPQVNLKKDVPVFEMGETSKDTDIATPLAVTYSTPTSKTKTRQYQIIASKNLFLPKYFAVYTGDIIRINFFSRDKDYDFSIPALGIKQAAPAGQQKMVEFQAASVGSFPITCDTCAGTDHNRGLLVVKPPTT